MSIGVLALIVINLALIVLVVAPKRPLRGGSHQPMREHRGIGFMLKELDLDQSQKSQFRALGAEHRAQKQQMEQQIRRHKAQLVAAVMHDDMEKKDSLLIIIDQLNQENERSMVAHFGKLKALCTPDQAEKLADLLSGEFNTKRNRKGHRPE
ncbi:MAG: hypothetical protein RIC03_00190 [Cyclobacteriaceae bacterium]